MHKISAISILAGILAAFNVSAYDFAVDGIYYNINSTDAATVAVTYASTDYASYTGDVVLPASVTYDGTTYAVKEVR